MPQPQNPATSRFVRACLRQPVDRTPVWFLRQAGRYMPEYMAVRKHHTLLEICRTPAIAAEVTITAAEILSVDAAIIFADLLLPLTPMGLDFEFVAGEGPHVNTPIRTLEQIQALRTDRTEDLQYVARSIELVTKHFAAPRPDGDQLGIIGFIGAPFTLASYMIEGGGSKNYIEAKRLMYASANSSEESRHSERSPSASSTDAVEEPRDSQPSHELPSPSATDSIRTTTNTQAPSPDRAPTRSSAPFPDSRAWPLLMEKLVTVLTGYARQQVEAGADVIQIFDSWAGNLSVADYEQFCLPATKILVQNVRNMGVPVIYFGVDTASLLPIMQTTGADVLGLDWRTPLAAARQVLGPATAVQGNLDPITLFAPQPLIKQRVQQILTEAARRPGHIFNLGHGIVPGTPVENVIAVSRYVRELSQPTL